MIKKTIYSFLVFLIIVTLLPIRSSAEWIKDKKGWRFLDDKSYSTGWKEINKKWYYFNDEGYMETGWTIDHGAWYYLGYDGAMVTGNLLIKGKKYEFYNDGKWINNGLPNKNNIESNPPSKEKIESVSNFSWFYENGNAYFKLENDLYITGIWNIDGNIYIFDNNGVLQTGDYTLDDGKKYHIAEDGKVIQSNTDNMNNLNAKYALTTKSNTDDYDIKLDYSNMLKVNNLNSSVESEEKIIKNTLYCKVGQNVNLGTIKVIGKNSNERFPNLIIMTYSSDENIAFSVVNLGRENDFFKNIYPTVIANKVGTAKIGIYINGEEIIFNVIVTE